MQQEPWRELEILVSEIEHTLAPLGIRVQSPERFYDDDRTLRAEIDVTLRGMVGSTPIFVGLECRLRPSNGKQDSAWIENIAGKGRMVGAHQMIAVSRTGFNKAAIRAAKDLNVELRTVEEADITSASTWFRATTMEHHYTNWDGEGKVQIEGVNAIIPPDLKIYTPIIRREDKLISVRQFISEEVTKRINQELINVPREGTTRYIFEARMIPAQLRGQDILLELIRAAMVIGYKTIEFPLFISQYRDPSSPDIIAFTGVGQFTIQPGTYRIVVVGTEPANTPEHRHIRVSVETLDGVPWDPTNTIFGIVSDDGQVQEFRGIPDYSNPIIAPRKHNKAKPKKTRKKH